MVNAKFLGKYLPKNALLFDHNVLMSGSPGSGKTLLARALSGILLEMSCASRWKIKLSPKVAPKDHLHFLRTFNNVKHYLDVHSL